MSVPDIMLEMFVKNKRNYDGPGIYIGRPSVLGNIFEIGKDGTRDEVVEKYDIWLTEKLKDHASPQSDEIVRLANILGSTGKLILICWCAPKRCHGEIVKREVEKCVTEKVRFFFQLENI